MYIYINNIITTYPHNNPIITWLLQDARRASVFTICWADALWFTVFFCHMALKFHVYSVYIHIYIILVNGFRIIPYIMENKLHVPNHQLYI